MHEDGAEVVAVVEDARDFQETLQRAFAVAEPFYVSDLLVGFQRETKTPGDAFRPVRKGGLGGHAIETMIDFDGGELLGIEAKHLLVRQLFRVKIALPLLIGISRSSH